MLRRSWVVSVIGCLVAFVLPKKKEPAPNYVPATAEVLETERRGDWLGVSIAVTMYDTEMIPVECICMGTVFVKMDENGRWPSGRGPGNVRYPDTSHLNVSRPEAFSGESLNSHLAAIENSGV